VVCVPAPRLFDAAELIRRGGIRATSPHWVLSSESESRLLFGSYCFAGCLTRVRTGTSACNLPPHLPVETQHPQVFSSLWREVITPALFLCRQNQYSTFVAKLPVVC